MAEREAEMPEADLPHSESSRPAKQRFRQDTPHRQGGIAVLDPSCYRLNYIPQNASVEVLIPRATVSRDSASKEVC